jgi:hypothetical protein
MSGQFNNEFASLIRYLNSQKDDGRYLWLPLNFPSYVVVEDRQYKGHYYYGTSPISMLSNKSDITGFLSFATTSDPQLNNTLISLFQEKKYNDVLAIFQKLNIRYIIVNRDRIPDWGVAHFNELGERDFQTQEFITQLLGPKLRSFGERYDVYAINPAYSSRTIYLSEGASDNQPIEYVRNTEGSYSLRIPVVRGTYYLHFRESFNPLWNLMSDDAGVHIHSHTIDGGFGNVWKLTLDDGVAKDTIHLNLLFRPVRYELAMNYLSGIGYVVMGVFVVFSWKKKKTYV